ncbi:MAG TPA: MtnX-like HAD-IB family phosphatase [Bacteroidota bacterium]|nr:MtnX-like HAD-IB family phosphatase [Bacteroidota bacterium]
MVRVFSDFDGTIAVKDVGGGIFKAFAGQKASDIVRHYLDGTINAREYLTRECEAVGCITPSEIEKFVDQFELDPAFGAFREFCRHRSIPIVVLSDGFDFYVERLLRTHGFGDLPFFSNHLEFVRDGDAVKMEPSFPHTDAECPDCANCKRNHLLTLSGEDDIIVYIGDGISDRCPIRYADIVFAKGTLIRRCQEQNITYHEFTTFGDIERRFELILQRKRIRKRREAEMARREVFAQG